jgi:tetratricopeptide (TPR) repeat protein
MRRLAQLSLAIALGGATIAAESRLEVQRERPYDLEFLPRSSAARLLSLGHPTLAANLYWLQAVQYMGEPLADARGWAKLLPIVDLVTDLDPGHGYAYQVAGNVLAGVGRVRESNQILEKGMRNIPGRYILPFHRAVNAMLYEGDYALAGRYFERAAGTPGAPEHLREYVVSMYVKGNQADAAISFLTHLLETSHDDESRNALEKQLLQARLERAALQIDDAVARYRERFVLRPFALDQLVAMGFLASIPPDPFGGQWLIDEDGRAHSSVNLYRFQRPMNANERASALRTLQREAKGPPPP